MNTNIIFEHPSPVCTVLINEATGQELYRIDTPSRVVGSVTKVFRCDPATPSTPSLMPDPHLGVDKPREGRSSDELNPFPGAKPDGPDEGCGNEGDSEVGGAGEEVVGVEPPLVEKEIARWYWKLFSSPRMVFEGKISTRAEYMPLKGKLRSNYVFNHKGVSYRWSLPLDNVRGPRLVVDSNNTFVAQFHPNLLNTRKSYLEVSPDGMAMLDHIVVTFIPVERRRS